MFTLNMQMKAKAVVPLSDPSFQHGYSLFTMRVDKAIILLTWLHILMYLISYYDHIFDFKSKNLVLFFGTYSGIVYAIKKKYRPALVGFVVLWSILIVADFCVTFSGSWWRAVKKAVDAETEAEEKGLEYTTVRVPDPESFREFMDFPSTYHTILFVLRTALSIYFFKVVLNFRRFILETKTLKQRGLCKACGDKINAKSKTKIGAKEKATLNEKEPPRDDQAAKVGDQKRPLKSNSVDEVKKAPKKTTEGSKPADSKKSGVTKKSENAKKAAAKPKKNTKGAKTEQTKKKTDDSEEVALTEKSEVQEDEDCEEDEVDEEESDEESEDESSDGEEEIQEKGFVSVPIEGDSSSDDDSL